MDLFKSHLHIHELSFSSPSPSSSQPGHYTTISQSSVSNFPIIALIVIGILAAGLLLASYYIIVIKCCLNLQSVSINQDTEMMHSPSTMLQHPSGLDQSAINSIPIVEFLIESLEDKSFQECSVCLAEFQDNEKLRRLPDCGHLFHVDCIDVWLGNNANCPLCRTGICVPCAVSFSLASSPRQDLTTCVDTSFVAIEMQQHQQRN